MLTELHAFLPEQSLPTRTDWQNASNYLDILLEFGPVRLVLGEFCPMTLKGEHTGVEAMWMILANWSE